MVSQLQQAIVVSTSIGRSTLACSHLTDVAPMDILQLSSVKDRKNNAIDTCPTCMDAIVQKQFGEILWALFDSENYFENNQYSEYTNLHMPTKANSLKLDDDCPALLLNCLVHSPSFTYFQQRMACLHSLLQQDKTIFPDRAVFVWLSHVLHWIVQLRHATLPDASLLEEQARYLFVVSQKIFRNIPEGVRQLFNNHLIDVAINEDSAFVVLTHEGCARGSPGVVVLCWCTLLVQALGADYKLFLEWKERKKIVNKKIATYLRVHPSPNVVHQMHICEQELWKIHQDEQDMVVRVGRRDKSTVREQLEIYLTIFSSQQVAKDYATTQFNTADVVGPYRNDLLDALLVRAKTIGQQQPLFLDSEEIVDYSRLELRDRTEKKLYNALRVRALNLPSDLMKDALLVSKYRAWEIEQALENLSVKKIDETQYCVLAKAILHSFGDPDSDLPLYVLCGHIEAEQLVAMSPDDFASTQIQRQRQESIQFAKRQLNLVRAGDGLTNHTIVLEKAGENKETPSSETLCHHMSHKLGDSKHRKIAQKLDEDIFNQQIILPTKPQAPKYQVDEKKRPADFAPTDQPCPKSLKLTSKVSDFITKTSPRLNIPGGGLILKSPSLELNHDSSRCALEGKTIRGTFIRNASKERLFHFHFAKDDQCDFSTCLEATIDNSIADLLLPPHNHMKGTTTLYEVKQFLNQKLKKNSYFVLRVRPQESDKEMYNKFIHIYENERQTLTMFDVPDGVRSKAFLITPNLQKHFVGVSFEKSSSVYLVGYIGKKDGSTAAKAIEI